MPKYKVTAATVQEYVIEVEANDLSESYLIASEVDISDERWEPLSFELQMGFAEPVEESN
jgi:hypothetical protein